MSDLKEITGSLLLEDILEREGVNYRLGHGSSGEQLNIHSCPFCGGSSWKVYANRDNGLGNCFHGSCGETFNLFTFTRAQIEGTNKDAYDYLERMALEMGWRPRRSTIQTEVIEDVEWELPDSYPLPTSDGRNLRYLEKRRVDGETAAYFHLRFCDDGWFNYTKPDGCRGGMNFGGRVIVPVYDLDGTMVTFQGRDITGESDRKYLFPPGLPGTGRFLFNGQNADRKERVIACEGAFDVIRTWLNIKDTHWGDAGVVGTFGIHLSTGQDGGDQKSRFLQLKRRGLKEVIMFWDGERKALEQAVRAGKELRRIGLSVKIARPPEDKDPGDLDSAETLAALDAAEPLDPMTALRLRIG